MVDTAHAVLEQAEEALHRVGVDVAFDVDFGAVPDAVVRPVLTADDFVGVPLVGEDHRLRQDELADDPVERLAGRVLGDSGPDLAAALDRADDAGTILAP